MCDRLSVCAVESFPLTDRLDGKSASVHVVAGAYGSYHPRPAWPVSAQRRGNLEEYITRPYEGLHSYQALHNQDKSVVIGFCLR